jgi:hypothetical protein
VKNLSPNDSNRLAGNSTKEIQPMTKKDTNDDSGRIDPAEQAGRSAATVESRAEREKILAELDQIENETFQEYTETARRDGGSQGAVAQGYIELSRRIWQNSRKAARDARERM